MTQFVLSVLSLVVTKSTLEIFTHFYLYFRFMFKTLTKLLKRGVSSMDLTQFVLSVSSLVVFITFLLLLSRCHMCHRRIRTFHNSHLSSPQYSWHSLFLTTVQNQHSRFFTHFFYLYFRFMFKTLTKLLKRGVSSIYDAIRVVGFVSCCIHIITFLLLLSRNTLGIPFLTTVQNQHSRFFTHFFIYIFGLC